MLSTISRMFQAIPALDTNSSKRTQRDIDSGYGSEGRKQSSHFDLSMASGPSNVAWKSMSDSSQNSPHQMSHSASSPSLSPGVSPTNTFVLKPNRLSSRTKSSQSLHLQSLYLSETGSDLSLPRSDKPLSPILEREQLPEKPQVYFPPQRSPSIDSIPPTPDSTRVTEGHAASHSLHQTFLTRQLKRSISQTSSTFRSMDSVVPVIPPLDLTPKFPGPLGHAVPRKSHLAVPTLPTVIGSPNANVVSIIHEDSIAASLRTASFITAPSERELELEHGPDMYTHLYSTSAGTEDAGGPNIVEGLGLYEVDLTDVPLGSAGSVYASTQPSTTRIDGDDTHRGGRGTHTSSDTDDFIARRWLKGVSFGSDPVALPDLCKGKKKSVNQACVLFWLGFIGPWCWLIGGWLLSRGGHVLADGQHGDSSNIIPMWTKNILPGDAEIHKLPLKHYEHAQKDTRMECAGHKFWHPFGAHSAESLHSSLTPNPDIMGQRVRVLDPWVIRCRVAAITSGFLLVTAFIVAVVAMVEST